MQQASSGDELTAAATGVEQQATRELERLTISNVNSSSSSHPQQQAPYSAANPQLPSLHIGHMPHSSSGGGAAAVTPHASAPSSPTAASEYSVATTYTSTSSAIPFSHIANQRKLQEREVALKEAAHILLRDASSAFDLRMESFMLEIATLQELNDAAAQQYGGSAEIAAALGQFVSDLVSRQAAAKEALAVLPQLDRQLEVLATAVSQLDKRSRQLEAKLGLKPLSGSGASSSSSAYSYLASGVSQLTAVGVSTAAAGLGCLAGGTADTGS